jgi:Endonuclease NucS
MESSIRDSLAANLHLIDSNLTLISKEYYLPNPEGTKSFVDVLAQDNAQNYVVIEIKRTNQAARQAIHEVIKYVEALKKNKRCTNSEIIVLVAAVDWKELIVPFSSFVRLSDFAIKGIKLTIDEQYNVISCLEVKPINEPTSRYISPVQACLLFSSRESLNKGIKAHESCLSKTELRDYIILIIAAENDGLCYRYGMYIAIQRRTKEDYIFLIGKDEETLEEMLSFIKSENFSEEEELQCLESNLVYGMGPKCDEIEAGSPAKLASILERENWSVEKVIRYGAFKHNELLSDTQIVDEMSGARGAGNAIYCNEITSEHIGRMNEIKESISDMLVYNIAWKSQICSILDYYKRLASKEDFNIKIKIYSPSNIIVNLFANHSEKIQGGGFPEYIIKVNFLGGSNLKKIYRGRIKWNGVCPDMDSILRKHFDVQQSPLSVFIWGRNLEENNDILFDMGCEYISLLHVYEAEKPNEVYLMDRYDFFRVDNSSLNYLYIDDLSSRCSSVISKINELFENVVLVDI